MKGPALDRRETVARLLEGRGHALLVTGLGAPTYDVASAGDSDLNFYLWGAMGGAAMVGLGLALAQPERRVVVVTGDGEMMMGVGGLATIGAQAPSNLAVLVLDNEAFGETGRQSGLTGSGVDLAGVAASAGFRTTTTVLEPQELPGLTELLFDEPGPVLAVAKVRLSDDPVCLPERDGPALVERFRNALLE